MALLIQVVSPTAPDGFSSDYAVASETPVVIDVTFDGTPSLTNVIIGAKYIDGGTDLVFFGSQFQGTYVLHSKVGTITDGFRFTLRSTVRWPGTGVVGDVRIVVQATDPDTLVMESAEFLWSLPSSVEIVDSPPSPAPSDGVPDVVAIALSRVPSQFLV